MKAGARSKIDTLIAQGVRIPAPAGVEIGDEVNPSRISTEGVVIHSGCRIFGHNTFIGAGARIGGEAPVTLENCWIGPDVQLKGGFFSGAVFLRAAEVGSGAHVRAGTLFEEGARAAHTVGLKHTILFPFVTLGSLINFCDCLMAGGTDRRNHSEVGSSYIHFNFTPYGDKATPSLIGDVPRGVMLDQPPIFLGGQGGLVGPCRLAFGTTVAAGTVCRKDELRPGRLIYGGIGKPGNVAYTPGARLNARRIIDSNLRYIANLLALLQWYRRVRCRFIGSELPSELWQGAVETLELAVDERTRRLEDFCRRSVPRFGERWPHVATALKACRGLEGEPALRDVFLEELEAQMAQVKGGYVAVIQSLDAQTRRKAVRWLDNLVEQIISNLKQ